jgi:hypothetical protein
MSRTALIAVVAVIVLGGLFWLGRTPSAAPDADDPFAPMDVSALRPQEAKPAKKPAAAGDSLRRDPDGVIARDLGGAGSKRLRADDRDDVAARPHAAVAPPADDEPAEPSDLARDLDGEGKDLFQAQLEEENLTGANLEGANLAEANLRKAQLDDANMKDSDLRGADLTGANMVGTDLSSAQLQGANLSESYIQANMRKADLRGADLRAAGLWGVHMNEADLRGANLQGATVKGDFMKADLRTADLRWASMDGVNLFDADLDNAVLLGATSLTCESLTIARNWQNAIRSPDLACGAPLPEIPPQYAEQE